MIRSSIPSPLISPAPDTEAPLRENESNPSITKPLLPLREDRFILDSKLTFACVVSRPNTTKLVPASRFPLGSATGAPTIRSLIPSPFISPAPETERPLLSSKSIPLITKPLLPSRSDRFKLAAKPEFDPKTT